MERTAGELWQASGPRLRRLAGHLLGQDADDGLQEAFSAIQRALPGFRGDSALSTWAYGVARRSLLDYRRRRDRRNRRERPAAAVEGLLDEPTLAAFEGGPLQSAAKGELRAAVRQAVQALPAPLREALVLRSFEGLRYAEIGEVLGIPLGTVKSRLAAASVRLARALARHAEDET